MELVKIQENGLHLVFVINDDQTVSLVHFSSAAFDKEWFDQTDTTIFSPLEFRVSGLDIPLEKHGPKYSLTTPGYRMKYFSHKDQRNQLGRCFTLTLFDEETQLAVTLTYQFYQETSILRCWTEVENQGGTAQGIEFLSSFALVGIDKEGLLSADEKLRLHIPHNSWQRELNWQSYTMADFGLQNTQGDFRRSSAMIAMTNTGNWSTKKYLPMGILENQETGSSLFWQIEHNGSWHWEISDQDGHLYLKISGPNEQESHCWKELAPGETFESVPVAVGHVGGTFDEVFRDLTTYRRLIRRENKDNEELPVIFNDYMNSLFGEPTTAKELPMIDKAAEAGCEYYCIDCGWYSAGYWWDGVGEWQESKERFPNGLAEVTDYIIEKGMIPGLWLELEVMGIKSPLVDKVSDDWFFKRHGKRLYDRSRYQLDFRNSEVRQHCTGVIDRLIRDYRIGYIKMDYNIDMGIGTDTGGKAPGLGLLEHNRAYLAWLDEIFAKYPNLVIENCSSGGLRMDYGLLSRCSVQSTSDQEDYVLYSTISANAPTGVTPEQAAVWSYPLLTGDQEEVVFNMVNSLLLRIHQSGHLAELSGDRFELVKEGIDVYKQLRKDLSRGQAFWPLGLANYEDPWAVLGIDVPSQRCGYLAVWRRDTAKEKLAFPLPEKMKKAALRQIYPGGAAFAVPTAFHEVSSKVTVELPAARTARLFKIDY